MATGSTEPVFATSSQTLPCFNSNLLKPSPNKYWDGTQVVATASTDSIWEDDPEEKVKKKLLASKSLFHMGRTLQIKHLPRDVTEAEIEEALRDFPVHNVHISNGAGSSMAKAELEDPEMLEEWDHSRCFRVRGQPVPVNPSPSELMLCVARLPLTFTEEKFEALVKSCGAVRRSFLMIKNTTGESKGYGFVEYKTNEISLQAKNMLDRREINGCNLVCDWLDSSHVTYESLHSKCLYVDHLPKDFRDMSEFRKIFSSVVPPPYCQIALKNGCPQDWGLVEYNSWEDAEAAQTRLNGYNLHGRNIRISYYIPGVRAINLYLKLLNENGPVGRSTGLLPEPSGQDIAHNLQNLFKQNPIFAQNLQSIIASQIQAAQNGEQLPDAQSSGPSPPGSIPDFGIKNPRSPTAMAELSKSPTVPPTPPPPPPPPPPPAPKNGFHPPLPPGPSPPQFLKSTPQTPTKIPLLPNPSVAPPSQGRHNQSPPRGDATSPLAGACTLPGKGEETPSNWVLQAGLLSHLRGTHPSHVPFTIPPPEPQSHTFALPPPNFIRDNPSNPPVDVHQSLLTLLSNPQNIQQILHSLSQPSTVPSHVAPATFSYPALNPMQGAVDPSWALTSTVAQPLPHLTPRSLLTSPIPVPMEVKPPPGPHMFPAWAPTFLPPTPQMFTPFGSPGIIWSQPSPIVSTQPNPLMTPIGQKRRLLPSPEPSPEGNYIGQHSQGIGGHYADSYFKRKKKN